jgi:diguanylate cyclase (GGDEF)-like protein/PAS domain S-box-containing protein
MGQSSNTYLATQPLPTGYLWFTLGVAWFSALVAVWLQQQLAAALLASAGLAMVATLGLSPIRRAFAREQSKLAALLNAASEGILEIDGTGRIVFVNPALCELFGYRPDEMLGQPVEMLVPPAFRDAHVARRADFSTGARSRPMGSGLDIAGVRKDGSLIAIDISLNRIKTRRGAATYCLVRDDSARKNFETRLVESNHRLTESVATLERHSFELRTLTEMGELLHGSNDEAELYGIVAHTMERLFPGLPGALYALTESRTTARLACAWGAPARGLRETIACDDCWALRRGRPHGNGLPADKPRCTHLADDVARVGQCIPLLGHGELLGVLHVGTDDPARAQDLCAPHRLQLLQAMANQIALSAANLRLRETLRAQSVIDPLTGVGNRRVLEGHFDEAVRVALAERRELALLVLDIDHFKSFNDQFGHDCGDIALREVGALLRRSLRHGDIVCRMGGEEFSLLLPDTAPQDAERVAEKLRHLVETLPLQREGRMLARITVSIGVAMLCPQADTAAMLLRRADRALYRAKAAGRNRVTIGGPDDDTGVNPRMSLVPRQA